MVISAGMGKGHNGAAIGLSRLLTATGLRVQVVDLLESMRFGYGRLINGVYRAQLRYAPWSYQAVYSAWREHPALVRSANGVDTIAARRILLERVDDFRPDAIISTYNLGSQVLGELSTAGDLEVPIYSFVTDFGVHPYWLHEGVSGYLSVHKSSARVIRDRTGAPVGVCGPLVDPAFAALPFSYEPPGLPNHLDDGLGSPGGRSSGRRRDVTRRALGVADRDIAVLVVAGGWGSGDVEKTVAELEMTPELRPVVVCGTNRRLYRRLVNAVVDKRRVIGLTDQMPRLMEAADVLVENAGGMTCFEGFASRLPVITYRPIPGHGIDNAHAMAAAGVTTFAQNHSQLIAAIDALKPGGAERDRQVHHAAAVFPPDPAAVVLDLIDRDRQLVESRQLTGTR